MPINYSIIYDSEDPDAKVDGIGAPPPVELVQDAIVKHDGSYVEAIEIVYTKDALGAYPTNPVDIELENTSYEIEEIDPVEVEGTNPFSYDDPPTINGTSYKVTFRPPSATTDDVFTLFNFGAPSGPPTKLAVKVKRKPSL